MFLHTSVRKEGRKQKKKPNKPPNTQAIGKKEVHLLDKTLYVCVSVRVFGKLSAEICPLERISCGLPECVMYSPRPCCGEAN